MKPVSEDKLLDGLKGNYVLLIYNPHSGSNMFPKHLDSIVAGFQENGMVVVPLRADGSISVEQMLSLISQHDFKKIIAAGGDGTINIVVNAMMENDINIPLAIFPAGTANDFAHYFQIPTVFERMLSIAVSDHYSYSDIGKCNGRYFVNVAAIGPVIDVSQKTDASMKNTLGILAYYLKGLSELSALKPVEFSIYSDEVTFKGKIFFMVVINGNSAGGFRKLGINAAIDDGKFDVILFKEMNVFELLPLASMVLQGKHAENKNVIYFQTSKLRIEAEKDLSTDLDGEEGPSLPLELEVVPKRLMINTEKDNLVPFEDEN